MVRRKITHLEDAPKLPITLPRRDLKPFLTEDEWFRLLEAARSSKRFLKRNVALILLLYERGLRREEIGFLRLSYADKLHEGLIYVWRGKGSRSGYEEISETTVRAIYDYIVDIYPNENRDPEAYIFPGKNDHKGLTGRSVYKIFFGLAVKARLPVNARHPHILKRTRCQHILEEAVKRGLPADAVYQTLAKLVGHASALTTIKHYTAQTSAEIKLVMELTKRLTATAPWKIGAESKKLRNPETEK